MSLHDRLFRAVMRLLPAEFRGDYQREMEATFRAERSETIGAIGIARLWAGTIADIFRAAPAEHFDILRRDVSYAFRMLARRPVLALTATITLALGIGANTAIFSVVNGVLLAPLPYPEADRLVLIQEDQANDEPATTGYFSFDALRSQHATFDWIAAMSGWSATLTGDAGDAERIAGTRVTWEFFRTLGIRPALGRDFEQQDDHPVRRRQVLLSDELWRRRFNADPALVGKQVTINAVPYTVAGVMPPDLREIVTRRLFAGTEIWTLLGYAIEQPQACQSCRHIQVIGRMKRGVDVRQAKADLTRIYQSLASQYPQEYAQPTAAVTPITDFFLGPTRQPLLLLWGAVGLLLLMTCANVANLLLIRASEREEEMSIRRALGVSPTRLLRQLLTESVLLAAIGGAAGAVLAAWGTRLIAGNGPGAIPRLNEVTVNGGVLWYAVGISVATGAIFGMAPARMLIGRSLTRPRPARAGGRTVTAGPGAWRYRAALVAVNVALSTLLLIGSGLLVRSFLRLLTVEPGFDPRSVLTMQIDLSGTKYRTTAAVSQFYVDLAARLAPLGGVTAVGASTQLPLTDSIDQWGVRIEGRHYANPAEAPEADRYGVTAGYFSAMGIPLLRGRLFTEADGIGTPPVIVIGKSMAERLWPGEDPIGRRVTLAGGPDNPPRTIVGIVGDVRHYGLHMPETMQAYMPQGQAPWLETQRTMVIRLRAGEDPLSIAGAAREQVRAMDPQQPVIQLRTYDAIVAESMSTRRFTLALLALFAGTALVLAFVGLYGALSYVVTQRQREIGVRVALGAGRREIRRLVLGQGMRPALAGLITGLVLAAAGGRVVESLLFGFTPADAVTFAAVMAILGAGALAACALPAARAARVDPAVTLRSE